jgi:hypothetical protein
MKNNFKNFSINQFNDYSISNLNAIFGGTTDPDIEKKGLKAPTNGATEEEGGN